MTARMLICHLGCFVYSQVSVGLGCRSLLPGLCFNARICMTPVVDLWAMLPSFAICWWCKLSLPMIIPLSLFGPSLLQPRLPPLLRNGSWSLGRISWADSYTLVVFADCLVLSSAFAWPADVSS